MKKSIECSLHIKTFTRSEARTGGEYPEFAMNGKPSDFPPGVYTFSYDYPLTKKATFTHKLSKKTSEVDLVVLGRDDYKRIYREEEKDSGNPGHIPGMLNRRQSEGRYGIWGHDLSDLVFETVHIDTKKKTVRFSVGS